MRAELDRSDAARLDLKQGAGGVVDLEFLLQAGVLALASTHPGLLESASSRVLIDALGQAGWFAPGTVVALHQAHATLLDSGLACTLDRRPRLAVRNEAIDDAVQLIVQAGQQVGVVFDAAPDVAG